MTPDLTLAGALFILAMVGLFVGLTLLQFYGVYVCFCKKWYIGLAALVFPAFALVIGGAKFIFKKELLQ